MIGLIHVGTHCIHNFWNNNFDSFLVKLWPVSKELANMYQLKTNMYILYACTCTYLVDFKTLSPELLCMLIGDGGSLDVTWSLIGVIVPERLGERLEESELWPSLLRRGESCFGFREWNSRKMFLHSLHTRRLPWGKIRINSVMIIMQSYRLVNVLSCF